MEKMDRIWEVTLHRSSQSHKDMSISSSHLFPNSTTDISYPLQIDSCFLVKAYEYRFDRYVRRPVYDESGRLTVDQYVLNENESSGRRIRWDFINNYLLINGLFFTIGREFVRQSVCTLCQDFYFKCRHTIGLCIGECTLSAKRRYMRATVAIKKKLVQGMIWNHQ